MAVIGIVIPYEVIGRYVFQKMSIWSGEVSTYSLAWASMLGGAVGLQERLPGQDGLGGGIRAAGGGQGLEVPGLPVRPCFSSA
ncbi:MAG: TRAP transporter small permease subunit [Desulfomicrobium escambiense]|nr:TRAP transporter small permease subunit [Desulfomicrobium escambiense]